MGSCLLVKINSKTNPSGELWANTEYKVPKSMGIVSNLGAPETTAANKLTHDAIKIYL